MIEFDMDSHSEIMGFVEAYFTQNIVQNNRHSHDAYEHAYHPASYTMAVKGVQKFNITENLFGNSGMDYELLAGNSRLKYTILRDETLNHTFKNKKFGFKA